jgi:hypothetical protein
MGRCVKLTLLMIKGFPHEGGWANFFVKTGDWGKQQTLRLNRLVSPGLEDVYR